MITSIFTQKYKVMAFSMSGLSILLSSSLAFLIAPYSFESEFWTSIESMGILIASVSILFFGSFPLFKMRILRVESQRLVFQNYVIASHIKVVQLKAYDFYHIVHEDTENGFFESVWLIKDGKLSDSFSTYQYSNYNAMETALNLENRGKLDLSPMKQLLGRCGTKIADLKVGGIKKN